MTQFLPTFVIGAAVALGGWAAVALGKGRGIAAKHWFGFVFLVPFPCMLAVHEWLGMSDALMVEAGPGERPAYLYNLVMVCVFFAGIAGYVVQAGMLAPKSRGWLAAKSVVLAAYWIPLLIAG